MAPISERTALRAHLQYTLVSDGSSDAFLMRVIDWVFAQRHGEVIQAVSGEQADFRRLKHPPKALSERIRRAQTLFRCDILFVHRDAESQGMEKRHQEIEEACAQAQVVPHVPVVPVRMTEAWLLINEDAIRRAADNPNGRTQLEMPNGNALERIVNPKEDLRQLLLQASGKTGRNRRKFEARLPEKTHRVADLIADFSALNGLPAFNTFCSKLDAAVARLLDDSSRRRVQALPKCR